MRETIVIINVAIAAAMWAAIVAMLVETIYRKCGMFEAGLISCAFLGLHAGVAWYLYRKEGADA